MDLKKQDKYKVLPSCVCNNCDYSYSGFFCPRCGQKHYKDRFSLKQSFAWLLDTIFNLEKGMGYTIKQLLYHPHEAITDNFKRATVHYMHPFRFVFVLATITALVTVLTGMFDASQMAEQFGAIGIKEPEKMEHLQKVLEVIQKYYVVIMLIGIPFNALASKLVYRKKKHNYVEHLILNCYCNGFNMALTLPTFLLVLLPGGIGLYSFLSTAAYFFGYTWILSKFYKENFILTFFKLLLIVLIGFLIASLITAIVVFIIIAVKTSTPIIE